MFLSQFPNLVKWLSLSIHYIIRIYIIALERCSVCPQSHHPCQASSNQLIQWPRHGGSRLSATRGSVQLPHWHRHHAMLPRSKSQGPFEPVHLPPG